MKAYIVISCIANLFYGSMHAQKQQAAVQVYQSFILEIGPGQVNVSCVMFDGVSLRF